MSHAPLTSKGTRKHDDPRLVRLSDGPNRAQRRAAARASRKQALRA